MSGLRVELVSGAAARTLLADEAFVEAWRELHARASCATAFQEPGFVRVWYETYEAQWEPVIAVGRDAAGSLTGLWLLAYQTATGALAHAGAHQAEYHVWLALPGTDEPFLAAAWAEIARRFSFGSLRFRFLPPGASIELVQRVLGGAGATIQTHSRPLLTLDAEEVKASFAKKSNKSRFNRLKKLGALEFRHVTDPAELDRIFDELIAFYDLRQGAVNQSSPFREDALKREFHRRLLASAPGAAYVTVTYVGNRPVSALWGAVTGSTMHLGMLAYSPLLAEHSPGKLHIMQLSDHLLKEGTVALDLTPGGDPWKERFANAHDEVSDVIVYTSRAASRRAAAAERLEQIARSGLERAGVPPAKIKNALGRASRARPAAVARAARQWAMADREFREYRVDRAMAGRFGPDARVRCNCLTDLLAFEPAESWQTRQQFLSQALERLERGELAFTVLVDGRLAHCGWMVLNQSESHMTEVHQSATFPPGSHVFYDFYSHPDFRGRGLYRATLGHMLHAAFAREDTQLACISVLADNGPSRHVIESMGWVYERSFFWRRRFGAGRTWATPVAPEPVRA